MWQLGTKFGGEALVQMLCTPNTDGEAGERVLVEKSNWPSPRNQEA